MPVCFKKELFIIFTTKVMNKYGTFMPVYYHFYLLPNSYGVQPQFFQPISFYPQVQSANESTPDATLAKQPVAVQAPKDDQIIQLSEQKPQVQPISKLTSTNIQVSKPVNQLEDNASRHSSVKPKTKRNKRPLTYLTEKAFYLRQKLKGKQLNGTRILRKRKPVSQKNKCRQTSVEKSGKKGPEECKTKARKQVIIMDCLKEKKILMKIRRKLLGEPEKETAEIPFMISGATELTQFCKQKLENLMSRRVSISGTY